MSEFARAGLLDRALVTEPLSTPQAIFVAKVATEVTRIHLIQPSSATAIIRLHLDSAGGVSLTDNVCYEFVFTSGSVTMLTFESPSVGSGILVPTGYSLVLAGTTDDDVVFHAWGVTSRLQAIV